MEVGMSKIIELVEKLPPDLEKEVIDFIEFLLMRKSRERNSKKSVNDISRLKGIFNSYADTSKKKLEKEAWELHVLEKWRRTSDSSRC